MSSMTGSMGYGGGNKIPKGYEQGQLQQFTPEQMNLFQSLFGHLQPDSFLSKLAAGDEQIFQQAEAPALRQFGQLQGQLASRFSGMGMGARKGSGFSNTMNQATSDFAQDLQSRRMDLQRQAIQDLLGLSTDLLGQRPSEKFLVEKQQKPSFWQQLLGAALPVAGAGVGGYFGGTPGAKVGGQVGSAAGQAFM